MRERGGMTAREQAIEAAAKAIFGGLDEVWERNPAEQAHYRRAAVAAVDAIDVPVLLNDLADRIDERRAPHITPEAASVMYERGVAYGLDVARNLVRAAAGQWTETNPSKETVK